MPRPLVEFHPKALRGLASCLVRPGPADYAYLATISFGINLSVRAGFAMSGIMNGGMTPAPVLLSMAWYQLQDILFTLFSRTYMGLLSRTSGALTVAGVRFGDLALIYVQVCASEVVSRLLLGPVRDTPAVLSAAGFGLVLLNVAQGMAAAGPIPAAISQARRAGILGERAAFHINHISGLTIHLGLLATFGHQVLHAWLTGLLCVASWSFYAVSLALGGRAAAESRA